MENNSKPFGTSLVEFKKPKNVFKKRTAALSRWLHVYLSMFSFIVVLFFSATGLTLNHAEWFDGKQVESKFSGTIPLSWVNSADTSKIKKLEIVELLRRQYDIKGYVSDFLIDDNQCSLSFKGPGYSADAFISRTDGKFKLSVLKLGIVAVLNDLHKGRDSGQGWGILIDVSAVLLILVSLSGLVMLLFLKKKRFSGIAWAVVGGVVCYLVYKIFVP